MTTGFDAAQSAEENDDLDRWRLATEITNLILSTPSEWSARIGIFAGWGEGKTTVLRFVESQLTSEDIVLRFNPWATEDFTDSVVLFGQQLMSTLRERDLLRENGGARFAKATERILRNDLVSGVAKDLASLAKVGTIYESAVSALSDWLKPDGEQIKAIRTSLGDRRVVVLIDDLDRCAQELLPKLLLSLRELLDLPGFVFVLAFDNEIVAKSLAEVNPAWGSGGAFLDKILDFKFYLPPTTLESRRKLVLKELARFCEFVPVDSTKEISDLLPENPRRLKALVRSFSALKRQVSRHDEDELNWVDVWFAQLFEQESHRFVGELLNDEVLDEEIGVGYRIRTARQEREFQQNDGTKDTVIDSMLDAADVDAETRSTLLRLIDAARERTTQNFRYAFDLIRHPQAITWKEFRAFRSSWVLAQSATTISDWITTQTAYQAAKRSQVCDELFDSVTRTLENDVSEAANAQTEISHDVSASKAQLDLVLLHQFLKLDGELTPHRFNVVYRRALQWIDFQMMASDVKLRQAEADVLVDLLSTVKVEEAADFVAVLKPWEREYDYGPFASENPGLKDSLKKRCVDVLLPKVTQACVSFLREPRSISRLQSDDDRFSAFRFLVFHPTNQPLSHELRYAFVDAFSKAGNDDSAYYNAMDLLRLFVRVLDGKNFTVDPKSVQAFLADEPFIAAFWSALISRRIQWRMQVMILEERGRLIAGGANADLLPVPDYLEPRMQELTKSSTS